MKSLNFKKIVLSVLVVMSLLLLTIIASACNKEQDPASAEIEIEGINVVINESEELQILYSANNDTASSSLSEQVKISYSSTIMTINASSHEWTVADFLKIIKQIRTNILTSSEVQLDTEYIDENGNSVIESGLATTDEFYAMSRTQFTDGKDDYLGRHWIFKIDDVYTDYYTDDENSIYSSAIFRKSNPDSPFEDEVNGVAYFCQNKFLFTTFELTDDNILGFKVANGKIYIQLSATIYSGENLEVTECFVVGDGRVVEDNSSWGNLNITTNYKYDDAVDLSLLTLPVDIDWTSENE